MIEENYEFEAMQTWPEIYYRKLLVKFMMLSIGLAIIPLISYLSSWIW